MGHFPNYSFIIAMLLIHNKYATLKECQDFNMFLRSPEKNDDCKKVWNIISVDLQ